jgi:hypothetical protein
MLIPNFPRRKKQSVNAPNIRILACGAKKWQGALRDLARAVSKLIAL